MPLKTGWHIGYKMEEHFYILTETVGYMTGNCQEIWTGMVAR